MQRPRPIRPGGAGARRLLLLGVPLLAAGCASATHSAAPPPSTAATTTAGRVVSTHAGESIVATAITREVPIYRTPSARNPFLHLANPTAARGPLTFLVRGRRPGWERVYLPLRPDGSTGWTPDRYLRLAWNPYSLRVRLHARQLVLMEGAHVVARFPAAVGRSVLPTPTGRYYIVELLRQPDPNGPYGPFAFGLSAYSHVLYSFGGGPGQIGIHGTNERNSIGHNASHGCIRIPNNDIVRLARTLPLGTPVTIGA
ncbi:MAG TPA: L,D-transpeptidase [Gaiellaceae bacterium]|nr:L,D-transpeptidase [Gaiellaceae bacterium]